jgi:hypothetical protein
MANKLGVAEQSSGSMVVCVKESKRLLLEEQEGRVNKFKVFGQIIQLSSYQYGL